MAPSSARNHLCKFCAKALTSMSHLKDHERTHGKNKPYSCAIVTCQKSFKTKGYLQKHNKRVHRTAAQKETARVYICDFCSKSFDCKSIVATHLKSHRKYLGFDCAYCGRGFALKHHRDRHQNFVCKSRFVDDDYDDDEDKQQIQTPPDSDQSIYTE